MSVKISRTTPPGVRPERHYRVADAARAVGHTIGSVSNYINQELNRKVATGITLKELADFLDGPRRADPRSQYDISAVVSIRRKLYEEFGILIEEEAIPDFREDYEADSQISALSLFKTEA